MGRTRSTSGCRRAPGGQRVAWLRPRELRHSFVSLLSASGVQIEQISQLVGHKSTQVTETVYRHELRPVLTEGAEAMDRILGANSQAK
ncbi:tyrosine-type recombinase/integrase [Kribbella solani]|uniref:tyrosine-type recombinase/integrase n=1 Tax=Kribbella solani TaxID=236067 RepID=UPI0038D3C399